MSMAMMAEGQSYILRTEGLSRAFGGFYANKDVNLKVKSGSIHALIGPNGAGKTTLFSMLSGFLQPSAGKIFYKGQDITANGATKTARAGIVRSFQISATFPTLSVHENIRIALQQKHGLARQFWLPETVLRSLDAKTEALIATVKLERYRNHLAANLSYGRKRVLELATTLALEPEIMLLDEPMAGMGHEDIEMVADIIKEVGKSRTIIMVEHNLTTVRSLCDQVTVLQRGMIIAEGSYAEISQDEQVRNAYIGAQD